MIIHSAQFELGAVKAAQWPEDGLPEFAFIGRSNVGKSSLLNQLLARKSLARVSQKPGKTQQINFFRINDQFRLVDLPGYGYAAVSKHERAWLATRIETYLVQRQPLQRVFHLIDIRHEPMENDKEVHAWLMSLNVPICIVATKQDKIGRGKVKSSVAQIQRLLQSPFPTLPVSAEKGDGIDGLWGLIEEDLERLRQSPSPVELEIGVTHQHAGEDEDAPE